MTHAITIDIEEESGMEVEGCNVKGLVDRSFVKPLLRVPALGEPLTRLTEPTNALIEPVVLGDPVSEWSGAVAGPRTLVANFDEADRPVGRVFDTAAGLGTLAVFD